MDQGFDGFFTGCSKRNKSDREDRGLRYSAASLDLKNNFRQRSGLHWLSEFYLFASRMPAGVRWHKDSPDTTERIKLSPLALSAPF